MNFSFSPEQESLRDTVRSFLSRAGPPPWTRLTGELGLTALAIGEEHGGFGASLVEVGIALEELGAVLAPVPYLSTVTAAAAIDPQCPLLGELATGATVATLALAEPGAGFDPAGWSCSAKPDGDRWLLDGVKEHVLDGGVADVAVVAADRGLFAVPVSTVARQTVHPTLDSSRGQATLVFEATPAIQVGQSASGALDLLWAGLAVESIGVARASLALTVEHLKTREQFGAPLSTFQALRHRVADLVVALEAATSSAWYAIRVAGTDEFAVAAPLAKLVATEAAYAVTAQSIQLLGGIGITWEHPAHRYLKRATANRLLAADPPTLRRLIGTRAALA